MTDHPAGLHVRHGLFLIREAPSRPAVERACIEASLGTLEGLPMKTGAPPAATRG